MERHRRSIVPVSWRATGTIDTFVISLLLTGSARLAGGIASVEVFTKMVLYYPHERAWSRIGWGGEDGRGSVEDDLHGPGRRPAGHRPPPGGDPPGAASRSRRPARRLPAAGRVGEGARRAEAARLTAVREPSSREDRVHYEIEIREHERGPDGDPRIVGRRWAAFKAFAADAVPRPLTFDSLEEPLAYTYRNPGIARIVRVADDGGREVVDAAVP